VKHAHSCQEDLFFSLTIKSIYLHETQNQNGGIFPSWSFPTTTRVPLPHLPPMLFGSLSRLPVRLYIHAVTDVTVMIIKNKPYLSFSWSGIFFFKMGFGSIYFDFGYLWLWHSWDTIRSDPFSSSNILSCVRRDHADPILDTHNHTRKPRDSAPANKIILICTFFLSRQQ